MLKPAYNGSSPRTRGTVRFRLIGWEQTRFIPADAGNRTRWPPPCLPAAVHPRGRGEQTLVTSPDNLSTGSSPRTRGTALLGGQRAAKLRFIPADAGNSWPSYMMLYSLPVHPRGRGEQIKQLITYHTEYGSSPRTRGTVPFCDRRDPFLRFIPADAGNSLGPRCRGPRNTVHPRGRGEQRSSRIK